MNCNKSIGLSFAFSLCLLLVLLRGYVKQELKSVSVKDAGFGTQLVLKSVSVSFSRIHNFLNGASQASLEPLPSSWQSFLITCGFVEEKIKPDDGAYLTWIKIAVLCIGLTGVVAFCISYQHWQMKKLHWKSENSMDVSTCTTNSLMSLFMPEPEPEPTKPTAKKKAFRRGNASVKGKNQEILNLRRKVEQLEAAHSKNKLIGAQQVHKIAELEHKNRKYERMLVICSTGLGIQSLSHMFRD